MLTNSKLFAVTAIATLLAMSSAFANEMAGMSQSGMSRSRDTVTHSRRHEAMRPAAPSNIVVRPLTPTERLEPFTAEEKAILDAPDPYHHPDEF
jgi:hypothetical protein